MADHEDYLDIDPKPVEIYQPDPFESFKVIQSVAASLKATVTQASALRTVEQATEANLKAIVSVNDFQELIDEVKLLRNCNLLVTGQTILYHAGDDGDLEKGFIKSYSVLDAGGYAGTTNIVINGKTHALSNNCVHDNKTGLMWARYVPTAGIGPATNGLLFWAIYTVTDTDISFVNATSKIHRAGGDWQVDPLCVGRRITIAGSTDNDGIYNIIAVDVNDITVAEALVDEGAAATVVVTTVEDTIWDMLDQANANSLGGHNDWRIPNFFELSSILNLDNVNPCTDATAFPSTPYNYHWASTTYPTSSNYAFCVHFSYGAINTYNKYTTKYYVRLVRGG